MLSKRIMANGVQVRIDYEEFKGVYDDRKTGEGIRILVEWFWIGEEGVDWVKVP